MREGGQKKNAEEVQVPVDPGSAAGNRSRTLPNHVECLRNPRDPLPAHYLRLRWARTQGDQTGGR